MEVATADDQRTAFTAFVGEVEPRLRRALVALRGRDADRDATAEALAWAWEHWDQVQAMDNPAGYLYRVGTSRSREKRRALLPVEGRPLVLAEKSDQLAVQLNAVMAGQFVFETGFHQRPKVGFALVSDFHGTSGEPDDGRVQLLVLGLSGVLAEGLQEAMRGEFAHAAEGMLARQVG